MHTSAWRVAKRHARAADVGDTARRATDYALTEIMSLRAKSIASQNGCSPRRHIERIMTDAEFSLMTLMMLQWKIYRR